MLCDAALKSLKRIRKLRCLGGHSLRQPVRSARRNQVPDRAPSKLRVGAPTAPSPLSRCGCPGERDGNGGWFGHFSSSTVRAARQSFKRTVPWYRCELPLSSTSRSGDLPLSSINLIHSPGSKPTDVMRSLRVVPAATSSFDPMRNLMVTRGRSESPPLRTRSPPSGARERSNQTQSAGPDQVNRYGPICFL